MTKADPDCLRLLPDRRLGSIYRLRGPVEVTPLALAPPRSRPLNSIGRPAVGCGCALARGTP